MSESGARNRRIFVSGASSRARAFSFIAKSASTCRCVVVVLLWPSHSAMTLNGTPDCNRCIAVLWRRVADIAVNRSRSVAALSQMARVSSDVRGERTLGEPVNAIGTAV